MKALEYAIRSLLRKRQTEKEIRGRIQKRHPTAPVEEVISRLKELNYINDEAFSEAWIRHRSLSSPKGKFQLERELRQKGVSSENRGKALQEYDEGDVLQELALKKWEKLRETDMRKKREKLMRFLLSRGFAISSVIEIVNSFAQNEKN